LSIAQADRLAQLWETSVVHVPVEPDCPAKSVLDVTPSLTIQHPLPSPPVSGIFHPTHRVTHGGDELQFPTGLIRLSPKTEVIEVLWIPSDRRGDGPSPDLMETAMGLALGGLGVTCLHAVAFSVGPHTILGVGGSGAGKSTITAAALRSGGRVASDDSVLACPSDDHVQLGPFRAYFSFRDATLSVLPDWLSEKTTEGADSHFLDRLACPDNLAAQLVPDRLWQLRIDRRLRASRIRRLCTQESLVALVSSASLLTLSPRYPRIRQRAMSVLATLAENCPGFEVRLGRDMLEEPEATLENLCNEPCRRESPTSRL
jgi:hypothetical protein